MHLRPRLCAAALAALLLAPASAALAQQDPLRELKEQVWKVEQRRVEALIMQDWRALEALLSEDLTYTHSNGATETKEQFLKALRTGAMEYFSLQHDEALVRVYGEAALLTGSTQARVRMGRGEPQDARLRFTMVYANEGGWWRLVAWQSTRLPEAESD
jgi:ketosteroid isomerase-like protein